MGQGCERLGMLPGYAKVGVRDLEALFRTVSRLVSLETSLRRVLPPLPEVRHVLSEYRKLVTMLYSLVSSMKLVPLAPIFSRAAQIALSTASRLGKEVEVRTQGAEILVDRRAACILPDVLSHLVKNAVDHGIEPPDERVKMGKPRKGLLLLKAEREGSYVVVSVEDDGRGIDIEEVKKRALEMGLITQEQAESLTWDDVVRILTTPGFSTKREATSVSGRGVGLDAVNELVKQLGGYMTIESAKGVGTRVKMYIPCYATAIKALIVRSSGTCLALPEDAVLRVVRPNVTSLGGRLFVHSPSNDLIPVVNAEMRGAYAVVLRTAHERAAVLVDEVLGDERVIVQPLPSVLRTVEAPLSGLTIVDGRICMVLDVKRLLSSIRR